MESLNESLFLWINASSPDAASLLAGKFLALALVYVYPLFLVLGWLRLDATGRDALIQAALTAVAGLLLGWLIARIWFHPRPFVLGLGQMYIPHRPNASFPSNHLTFIWSVCTGLWASSPVLRRSAAILALLGLPVAWARIYLGVHFPLDMLGAFFTACLAALLCLPLRNSFVPCLRRMIEPVYQWLFAWPIRKGWVRA